MPSTSKAQQRLMGMAYAYKKGELAPNEVTPDIKQLADSMTLKQLKDFASTKHEGLPDQVSTDENIALGNLGGMGANFLPNGTEVGSGDILSGTGSAEEEYKKKKKKRERIMKTFEEFVNESNKMAMSYKLKKKDEHDVEFLWNKLSKDKTKERAEIIDQISDELKINWFEISAYIRRNF